MNRLWTAAAVLIAVAAWAPCAGAGMEDLYIPGAGGLGAVTGWEHRTPSVPGWVKATQYQEDFTKKYVRLAPGENYNLAEVSGPGVITRIFFTLPVNSPKHNLRGLVLKIYWDGEENPSVLSPLGDFFGAPFGLYREYDSEPMSMQGGGMVCRFLMPFRQKARVVIENGWPDEANFVFFGINWITVPELPAGALYFHSLWRRTYPTVKGEPHVVADLEGSGNYVGLQLYFQNRSVFIGKGFNTLMQPEGFGMGNLEGWEEMTIDGRLAQHGTGTEEYFNAGAYFATGTYSGIYEGVHMRSYLTGRTSTYRFHVHDPVPFTKSFRMIWHHGLKDVIDSDYASVACWYQTEPHKPQSIPPLEGRIPSGTLGHAAQAVIMAPLVFGNAAVNRAAASFP